jgi:hypothetical protein
MKLKKQVWVLYFSKNYDRLIKRILDNPPAFQEIRTQASAGSSDPQVSVRDLFLSSCVRLFSLLAVLHTARDPEEWQKRTYFTLTSKLFHLIHVELAEAGCRDWSRSLSAFGPRCSDSSKRAALESDSSY